MWHFVLSIAAVKLQFGLKNGNHKVALKNNNNHFNKTTYCTFQAQS